MERKTLLALLLMAAMTVGYIYYQRLRQQQQLAQQSQQQPPQKPPTPPPEELKPTVISEGQPETPEAIPTPPPTSPEEEWPKEPVQGQSYVICPPGGVYELTFSSVGACLKSAKLLNYYTDHKHTEPLHILEAYEDGASLLITDFRGQKGLPLGVVNYEVLSQDDTHIEFQHTFANGLRVTKRFEFPAGAHHLLLTVTLHNAGQTTQTLQYELAGGLRVVPERQDQAYLFAMAARHEGGKNRVDSDDKMRPASVKKKGGVYPRDNSAAMPIVWVGSTNKYFAALLKPLAEAGADSTPWIQMARFRLLTGSEGQPSRLGGRERTPFDNVSTSVVTKEITLKAGESSDPHKYLFYVGPKSSRLLKQSPEYAAFAPVIDYGWFDFISITLLTLLQAFHKVIPNYGVAIILLTIVVRAALHPLTRKAQISMARMQKLAPEIKKLQEKFKHDKQRLGREQMELFKKQGVNPMGGCLPLLLQFPIIIGLYRALELSVDLRDAPFVFWVRDLSRPDTINAGGGFPINILPVVMIASWIVQQKMMPKSPDPQARRQQTMMTVMTTVLFGWIFYFIASGLTLYWLTSTLLGIAEQKFIQRSIRRMGEAQEAVA